MRALLLAAALAATIAPSLAAQPPGAGYDDDRGRGGRGRDDRGRDDRGRGDRGSYDRGLDGRDDQRGRHEGGPGYVRSNDWQRGRQYDWNRPDPRYGRYDASRYYRDDRSYSERRLGRADRVYYGSDGRYYCRRSDGTTGLIVGGVLGGAIGNSIERGGSSTLATLLGVAGGAALGNSIDRGNVRCR